MVDTLGADAATEYSHNGDCGSYSPPPVRRSKRYEEVLLKQLRKSSRQLCLETAYACDRHSVHYQSSLELTLQRHDGSIGEAIAATGSGQRLQLRQQQRSSTEPEGSESGTFRSTSRDPGAYCKDDARTVQHNGSQADSAHAATAVVLLPSPAIGQMPATTSVKRSGDPSGRGSAPSCSSQQISRERDEQLTADSSSCSCAAAAAAAAGEPRTIQGRSHPMGFYGASRRPKTAEINFHNVELFGLTSSSDMPAHISGQISLHKDQLPRPKMPAVNDANDACLLHTPCAPTADEAAVAGSFSHLQIEDERESLTNEREPHMTEVLRHHTKPDGHSPAEADRSDEQTSGDESAAWQGRRGDEKDGSDSGTGIEAYHPDNPSVLRKKIDDLESQIQDLHEANVATYEEVLRLQKENRILKEQSCPRPTAGGLTDLSLSVSADRDEPNRPETRNELAQNSGTDKCASRPSADRMFSTDLMWESDAIADAEPPQTPTALYKRDTSAVDGSCGDDRDLFFLGSEIRRARCDDASPRGQPYLRPKRLTYDEDADGEVDRVRSAGRARGRLVRQARGAPREVALREEARGAPREVALREEARGAPREVALRDMLDCWPGKNQSRSRVHDTTLRTSSDVKPGDRVIRISRETRAVIPRTLTDVSIGDSIKYTRPDGRVGRGVVSYVGWSKERREMCVGIATSLAEDCSSLHMPASGSSAARIRKDVVIPFQKVLLIWKKAELSCGCSG